MNFLAGTCNALAARLVRWHGVGSTGLALLLGLGLPAMLTAQVVVPVAHPPLPGAAAFSPNAAPSFAPSFVPTARQSSKSGPQPIPESLLHSAIVPPPAQTYIPSASVMPIPAAPPAPVVSSLPEEPTRDMVVNGSLEEKHLLPLLLREQDLLKRFGKDHPEVQAVEGRIRVIREWLAHQPPPIVRVEARTKPANEPANDPTAPAQPTPLPVVQEIRLQPAPVAPPAIERVIEVRQLPAEQPASSSTKIMVQLVSILAALVVVLLVQLVVLVLVVRRYAGKLTPQVRVEVVNAGGNQPATPPGEVLSQRVYLESNEPARGEFPPPMPEMPSFEDVRKSEEEAAQEQDEAVFRQVFEDNLRLREQLAASSGQ